MDKSFLLLKRKLLAFLVAAFSFTALVFLSAWVLPLKDYADATFLGHDLYDNAGDRVAIIGDVNGDGLDDFLIGSSGGRALGAQRGMAYLFLGRATASWGAGFDLAQADASFCGEQASSIAGHDVSAAGDVNGDGFDDFLIGAFHYTAPGNVTETGKVYLLLGRRAADWGREFNLASADASFVGEAPYDQLGGDVDAAGDVNGDGYDDFIIGANRNDARGLTDSGKACLFLGRAAANWGQNVPVTGADASFVGEAASDCAGIAVGGAGDVNGDGYDDLIIGAYGNDAAGSNSGKAYLILGRANANWGRDFNLSGADAIFVGERSTSYAGCAVAGVGDMNGDGLDDLVIGACYDSETSTYAGQSYLILGRASANWGRSFSLANADASYRGAHAGDESGSALAGAGDVNGDGYADWLLGAHRFEATADMTDTGRAYLVLGRAAGWARDTDLSLADGATDIFVFDGEARGDQAGTSVAGGGDVNGDGLADLLFGAPYNDENGSSAGKAYLVLGRGLTLSKTASTAFVLPGQRITYTMHYANTNFWTVEGVRIVDRIPEGTFYIGCAGGITCTRQGSLVTWVVGNVISQTSGSVRMVVSVPLTTSVGTVITNTAWITAPSRLRPLFSEALTTVGVQPSTPTPTATALRTPTSTATPTATASRTPSRTATSLPQVTATPTRTGIPGVVQRIYLPIVLKNAPTAAQPTPATTQQPSPTATATLATLEHRYSDDSAESYQSAGVGQGFATFFPSVPANWRLVRARYYLRNPAPIQIHIWDHNKVDRFAPFTAYPGTDGWFEVDLMGLGLYTTADDFYVGFTYLEGYRPDIGVDTTYPRGYSYEVDGAYFELRASLEYMIGIVVGQ